MSENEQLAHDRNNRGLLPHVCIVCNVVFDMCTADSMWTCNRSPISISQGKPLYVIVNEHASVSVQTFVVSFLMSIPLIVVSIPVALH